MSWVSASQENFIELDYIIEVLVDNKTFGPVDYRRRCIM